MTTNPEPGTHTTPQALEAARRVLRLESRAVAALEGALGTGFERAVEAVAACRGRVLTSGVGKSGMVAARLAATLTSTGTPAVFIHPVEALHGDLGLVSRQDVVVLISKSGQSTELGAIIPTLKLLGLPLIGILSNGDSPLAGACDIRLSIGRPEEGCPFDLVPTSSAAAAQALGDALAMAVLTRKGFRREDFTFYHPGGAIGRAGLLRVRDVMRTGPDLPMVDADTPLRETLHVILDKGIGLALVRGQEGRLEGILTDGDFKRLLLRDAGLLDRTAGEVMTRGPRTVAADAYLSEAVRRMEENPGGSITSLVVLDGDGRLEGVLHLHDCLKAGLK
ncbi:MAG: KpsF/GutQ family sugar-phosphate isomerase [Candidatus Eisenbacteria bacterium]|nr:KpsF/GutQ family sugar-phosphate isomerase [Candidatus Eisenbacteria bacterium]